MQLAEPTVIEIPTILTTRLVLRGWRAADIDPYTAMNTDPPDPADR